MPTATAQRTPRSIHVVPGDIKPRSTKRKEYKVPMSRTGIGRFIRYQMWKTGYFVTVRTLRQRTEAKGASTATFTDPDSGKRYRGVFAWRLLSEDSQMSMSAVRKLAEGRHKRSPEFFTVIKVFRALGLELKAAVSDDTNVDLIVRGW